MPQEPAVPSACSVPPQGVEINNPWVGTSLLSWEHPHPHPFISAPTCHGERPSSHKPRFYPSLAFSAVGMRFPVLPFPLFRLPVDVFSLRLCSHQSKPSQVSLQTSLPALNDLLKIPGMIHLLTYGNGNYLLWAAPGPGLGWGTQERADQGISKGFFFCFRAIKTFPTNPGGISMAMGGLRTSPSCCPKFGTGMSNFINSIFRQKSLNSNNFNQGYSKQCF